MTLQVETVESERAAASLQFLASASEKLSESLDYDETLTRVTHLAVPYLADWCTVDLMDPDGRIHRVAAAHADPAREALLYETLAQFPIQLDEPRGVAIAIRTGRTLIQPEVTPEEVRTVARDQRHLEILLALRPRSHLIVPLISHGQRLGALSLLYSDDSGRRYSEDDRSLAEDLARRCAQAVENAQLYRAAEQAVALRDELLVREQTARTDAEAALRQRDEFLSVAAHELKTPMTSLLGAVQLLRRQHDRGVVIRPEQMYRALGMIDRQASRLSRSIGQLFDTSQIEVGRLEPRWSVVDLAALVGAVVEQVQAAATGHEIVLASPPHLTARVDALRIEQVIDNLLDNAVKFSPDGGRIDVELSQPDPAVVQLVVRDRGIGIPPASRQGMFDRYYQAHAESHRSGLGLGLYVSRRIVELHGGETHAEFPEDGGTRFVVRVPMRPSV